MRKSIVPSDGGNDASTSAGKWLDLDRIARAEISSEDPAHPFENALTEASGGGWRAAVPGPQVIRLHFDSPQTIRRIRVQFRESQVERSQEFAIFATIADQPRRQVVRQQWGFSPGGSTAEAEDYRLELDRVSMLEVEIDPGRHDKQVVASLEFIGIA